jgi:mono/diheme cytochrome c family protein
MRFLAGLVFGILALGAAATFVVTSGTINAGAASPPGKLETRLAHFALNRSVSRRAPRVSNPAGRDADAVKAGGEHYKEMCVGCHGAPGVDASEIGEGLNPPAPDLTLDRVQRRSDGELYWIVQNGVRMSGMPAFGATHKDRQIWEIVAFLRHLPSLTPEEQKVLAEANRENEEKEEKEKGKD